MSTDYVGDAIQQIEAVRVECQKVLLEIKEFSPPDDDGNYHRIFRLISTPMFYSVWERCFTLCHAVTLRPSAHQAVQNGKV